MSDLESFQTVPARRPHRGWRVFASLLPCLVILGIGVAVWGAYRVPAPPAAGTALGGTPTTRPVPQTLRVASFNIHSAVGTDGKRDLDRVANLLSGFDVVGLNEIHGTAPDGFSNQADWLGHKLGTMSLFAPTERRWWHDSFGNGLLATVPIESWVRFPTLGTQERGRRNVVIVRVPVADRIATVVLTHVDCCDDRIAQLRFIRTLFLSVQEPAILIGDMNTRDIDVDLRAILDAPGVVDVIGEKLKGDPSERARSLLSTRIDWIFARGMDVVDGGIVENDASDHPMVWGELRPRENTPAASSARTTPQASTQPTTQSGGGMRP